MEEEIVRELARQSDTEVRVWARHSLCSIFWRRDLGYAHHALLVDGEELVEVTGGRDTAGGAVATLMEKLEANVEFRPLGPQERVGMVVEQRLEGDEELRAASRRLQAAVTVWGRARSAGKSPYDLRSANCEHFVRFVMTGRWESGQGRAVHLAFEAARSHPKTFAVVALAGLAAVAWASGKFSSTTSSSTSPTLSKP